MGNGAGDAPSAMGMVGHADGQEGQVSAKAWRSSPKFIGLDGWGGTDKFVGED